MFDQRLRKAGLLALGTCAAVVVMSCGGDTGTSRDSGTNKTYLSVAATDADGDALQYQWRVTAGTIENRNARETVWTMPDGPGVHFAYVMVSDGKGGYAEQQYAVGTDALETPSPVRAPVSYPQAASAPAGDGVAVRLRFSAAGPLHFSAAATGDVRDVYLPDVPVEVTIGGNVVSTVTDLSGEVNLPQAVRTTGNFTVRCATNQGAPLGTCATPTVPQVGSRVIPVSPAATAGNNVRLHGHVGSRDGGVCGMQNEFFGIVDSATVQLFQDGAALAPPRRVNRFGDYAVEAPGDAGTAVELRVRCGSAETRLTIDPPSGGFAGGASRLVAAQVMPNSRPVITRVVANGPEGNLRGRMVVPETGAQSNGLPGAHHFLSYKNSDTALSACQYYRSFGAATGCDAQGRMQGAISFDDWRRAMRFAPFAQGNTEVRATYVNRRDLNLVRQMVSTRWPATGTPTSIAFYVCNNPGPERGSQAEVDEAIRVGLENELRVACVAMEWTSTPGVAGGQPFTKFLTFGPDGSLIPSVNLDGRGEKYMPGACIACHGGSDIGARFPEHGNPSPLLGARFLPFDTGNYAFASSGTGSAAGQELAFRELNANVLATEGGANTPTARLYTGWYGANVTTAQQDWVPDEWVAEALKPGRADAPAFYRGVIARSCRTCHVALGPLNGSFDWDSKPTSFDGTLTSAIGQHACGGSNNLAVNAVMPNALASMDRLAADRGPLDSELGRLMEKYLGCAKPLADPVHARR